MLCNLSPCCIVSGKVVWSRQVNPYFQICRHAVVRFILVKFIRFLCEFVFVSFVLPAVHFPCMEVRPWGHRRMFLPAPVPGPTIRFPVGDRSRLEDQVGRRMPAGMLWQLEHSSQPSLRRALQPAEPRWGAADEDFTALLSMIFVASQKSCC